MKDENGLGQKGCRPVPLLEKDDGVEIDEKIENLNDDLDQKDLDTIEMISTPFVHGEISLLEKDDGCFMH